MKLGKPIPDKKRDMSVTVLPMIGMVERPQNQIAGFQKLSKTPTSNVPLGKTTYCKHCDRPRARVKVTLASLIFYLCENCRDNLARMIRSQTIDSELME